MNLSESKTFRVKISKADAVRSVTNGNSAISNQTIKDLVWKNFGLTVETNQILGIVGPESKRRLLDGLLPYARKLVELAGSYRLATNLINRLKKEGI